jgi:hypothetical protein
MMIPLTFSTTTTTAKRERDRTDILIFWPKATTAKGKGPKQDFEL